MFDGSRPLNDLGVSAFRSARAKVGALGEALQFSISILNGRVSIVTREPRRTSAPGGINDTAAPAGAAH